MFLAHEPGMAAYKIKTSDDAKNALWLDLIEPTDEELQLAQKLCGQSIPSPKKLHCIERSSQISVHDGSAFLSVPCLRGDMKGYPATPLGLILTGTQLFTIRFAPLPAFDAVAQLISQLPKRDTATTQTDKNKPHNAILRAGEILVVLIEFIADSLTTLLETTGEKLNEISGAIFTPDLSTSHTSRKERAVLLEIGHIGNICSRIRTSLLGIERITLFLAQSKKTASAIPATGFALNTRHALQTTQSLLLGDAQQNQQDYTMTLSSALRMRLTAVNKDVTSLEAYLSQLQSKDEFLLDATLGFISTEQNGVMKVLTVVTFIGMAPTLIAGIYGMNFKYMPELSWSYGYWYALSLMLFCVVAPLLCFWKKGWLRGIK